MTEYVREASVNAEVVQNFIQEHNAVFRDLSGITDLSVVMPDSIGHPSHIV